MIILDQIAGLADSRWSGVKGSVFRLVGLDIQSTPGLTKVHQKLTRLSAESSDSASISPSPSTSQSLSRSPSASASGSPSPSRSPSSSASPSSSSSLSRSPSSSRSPSASTSLSPSASRSPSASSSPSSSTSSSPSASVSASVSPSTPASVLVDGFIKERVAASNGFSFWFDSDSGKIWAVSSGGTVTLAYTTVPEAGEAKCLGALEYNGYIYWATESRLHRVAIADADAQWLNVEHNWKTFAVTDNEFHPMAIQNLRLFIGDGNQIAEVDATETFRNNVLDINTPLRIKTMIDYEIDLLLGTFVASTVNKTEIIRWDTISPSWNVSDPIEEVGVNAFIRDDNIMLVNAGKQGNIYFYNGEKLERFKRIPGEYSNTATGIVHPGSVANFNGVPIFGFSNGTGNPTLQGIYSLGSYSRNYSKKLSLDWVISENITSNIEIGAMLVIDGLIYVAWKSGTVYGIDQLDMNNKYDDAYLETRMLFQNKRHLLESLRQVSVLYGSLPTGTNFVLSYSVNEASFVSMANETATDTILNSVRAKLTVPDVGSLRLKVAFTVNGNDAPTMEVLSVES